MQQRITVAVFTESAGTELLNAVSRDLNIGGVASHFEDLMREKGLLFYSEHLDRWSMRDTFERFLRPRSRLRIFPHHADTLFAILVRALTTRLAPRNEEERLLRELLRFAKARGLSLCRAPWQFVLRRVLGVS